MQAAEATSHGAITIVNAMATGKGAALGVRLWTKARVTLTRYSREIQTQIIGQPEEDTSLLRSTVNTVFREYGAQQYGAVVETESNIPIAVGLKSSSAASNAIAAATLMALGRRARGPEVVRLAVAASLEAGVTLTGAFDDACACYFGGLIVTNNRTKHVLRRVQVPPHRYHVLIYVPVERSYSGKVRQNELMEIADLVEQAHREVLKDRYLLSLTLNGIAYSKALGYDVSPAIDALHEGAVAAGLSGKGPAFAAIVPNARVANVISAWRRYSGRVIDTTFNFENAIARSISI
jgi:shikimate kinase